ncbi:hypothetical protein ACFV84_02615 [Kitasatospora sp. NPDC059811]|uniref:hypothetical protein n=1 Tax=Streptomycetaceae TaxID=2062 RepID=UPI001FCB4387|nr:hypothetical protein [Streptomyces sp. MJM8645]
MLQQIGRDAEQFAGGQGLAGEQPRRGGEDGQDGQPAAEGHDQRAQGRSPAQGAGGGGARPGGPGQRLGDLLPGARGLHVAQPVQRPPRLGGQPLLGEHDHPPPRHQRAQQTEEEEPGGEQRQQDQRQDGGRQQRQAGQGGDQGDPDAAQGAQQGGGQLPCGLHLFGEPGELGRIRRRSGERAVDHPLDQGVPQRLHHPRQVREPGPRRVRPDGHRGAEPGQPGHPGPRPPGQEPLVDGGRDEQPGQQRRQRLHPGPAEQPEQRPARDGQLPEQQRPSGGGGRGKSTTPTSGAGQSARAGPARGPGRCGPSAMPTSRAGRRGGWVHRKSIGPTSCAAVGRGAVAGHQAEAVWRAVSDRAAR